MTVSPPLERLTEDVSEEPQVRPRPWFTSKSWHGIEVAHKFLQLSRGSKSRDRSRIPPWDSQWRYF
jgi:hypothetical protein